ncbi:MAG: hypothetical protein ABIR66_10025 [Saprospiraceae bacterium]
MKDDIYDPGTIKINDYGRLNSQFLKELTVDLVDKDIEEEDDIKRQDLRMPQFRINERRNKFYGLNS